MVLKNTIQAGAPAHGHGTEMYYPVAQELSEGDQNVTVTPGGWQRAQPVAKPQANPADIANRLKLTLAELGACQTHIDIEQLSLKVRELTWNVCGSEGQLFDLMLKSQAALAQSGQKVKAKRIGEIRNLLLKLPQQSPQQKKKTLKKVLRLLGDFVGVKIGKRGLCGSTCCKVACITGSVLIIAGGAAFAALWFLDIFEGESGDATGDNSGDTDENNSMPYKTRTRLSRALVWS